MKQKVVLFLLAAIVGTCACAPIPETEQLSTSSQSADVSSSLSEKESEVSIVQSSIMEESSSTLQPESDLDEVSSPPELEIHQTTSDGKEIIICMGYALDFNNDGSVSCEDYEISGYIEEKFVEELLSVYNLAGESEAEKLLNGEISIACGVSTHPAELVEDTDLCGYPLAPES